MSCFKKTVVQMGVRVGLGVGLLLSSAVLMPAMAGQNASPDRHGLPGRRISGGTRSECMSKRAPIVALTPKTNLSETASDRPSVHFIVPALEKDYPLEFSLRDSEGNKVYKESLNTQEVQGIASVQLPPQTLKEGKKYQWHLAIVCEVNDPSQNDVLSGWLRQVEPEVAMETGLGGGDVEAALELADSYQASGLWNDAVGLMVELQAQHPEDVGISSAWEQLLQALNVETAVGTAIALK